MRNLTSLILGALLLATGAVRADVAVLVHGYLGSAASWESSGVNAVLEGHGWQRAGVLIAGPGGVTLLPPPVAPAQHPVYAVELPSLAPMAIQADHLQALLAWVAARHPGAAINLVAHSAGGVVARLVLARNGAPGVARLVTIASPHLGTLRALEALEETHEGGPFGWFKDFFGGGLYHTVKDSWGALVDLTPPTPGNLLYWLNQQPHPEIDYHAIVRTGPVGLGDELIPAYSQDLNNVPPLHGKAKVTVTPADHALNPADGVVLAGLLKA
jgi:triacylglycerol lipase